MPARRTLRTQAIGRHAGLRAQLEHAVRLRPSTCGFATRAVMPAQTSRSTASAIGASLDPRITPPRLFAQGQRPAQHFVDPADWQSSPPGPCTRPAAGRNAVDDESDTGCRRSTAHEAARIYRSARSCCGLNAVKPGTRCSTSDRFTWHGPRARGQGIDHPRSAPAATASGTGFDHFDAGRVPWRHRRRGRAPARTAGSRHRRGIRRGEARSCPEFWRTTEAHRHTWPEKEKRANARKRAASKEKRVSPATYPEKTDFLPLTCSRKKRAFSP